MKIRTVISQDGRVAVDKITGEDTVISAVLASLGTASEGLQAFRTVIPQGVANDLHISVTDTETGHIYLTAHIDFSPLKK